MNAQFLAISFTTSQYIFGCINENILELELLLLIFKFNSSYTVDFFKDATNLLGSSYSVTKNIGGYLYLSP